MKQSGHAARAVPWAAAAAFALVALWAASDYGFAFDSQIWLPFGNRELAYLLGTGPRPASHLTPAFEANGSLAAIGAALTSALLHRRLALAGAVVGHHAFVILSATLVIGLTAGLGRRLMGWRVALWAAVLLAAHPRFFAEAQNNLSDVPAAAASAAFIYWAVRSVHERRVPPLCAAAVAAAALGAIRLPNLAFLPLVPLGWVLLSPAAREQARVLWARVGWRSALLVCGVLVACLWLFRPLAWAAPLAELRLVIEYFLLAPRPGHFRGAGPLFYWGSVRMGGPAAYHPVMLALTTPLPVLLIGFWGAWVCWRRHRSAAVLLLVWIGVVLGRHVILGLGNYDGVRHVIDAFPAFAIIGAVGADALWDALARPIAARAGRRAGVVAGVVGSLIVVGPGVRGIVTLHPYPVAYYNAVAGGLGGAASRFEAEYSGAVYRQGVEWAAAELSNRDLLWVGRNHNDYLLARLDAAYLELGGPEIVPGPLSAVTARWRERGGRVVHMQMLRPGPFERSPRGLDLASLPILHEVRRDGVVLLRAREVPADRLSGSPGRPRPAPGEEETQG